MTIIDDDKDQRLRCTHSALCTVCACSLMSVAAAAAPPVTLHTCCAARSMPLPCSLAPAPAAAAAPPRRPPTTNGTKGTQNATNGTQHATAATAAHALTTTLCLCHQPRSHRHSQQPSALLPLLSLPYESGPFQTQTLPAAAAHRARPYSVLGRLASDSDSSRRPLPTAHCSLLTA